MSELLDIVDEDGEPTGVTVDREVAHRDGIRHRTSHVWLVRKGPTNALEVLLQKRAADKDAFPEIETVRWMDIGECIRAVENKTIPNCISAPPVDLRHGLGHPLGTLAPLARRGIVMAASPHETE